MNVYEVRLPPPPSPGLFSLVLPLTDNGIRTPGIPIGPMSTHNSTPPLHATNHAARIPRTKNRPPRRRTRGTRLPILGTTRHRDLVRPSSPALPLSIYVADVCAHQQPSNAHTVRV